MEITLLKILKFAEMGVIASPEHIEKFIHYSKIIEVNDVMKSLSQGILPSQIACENAIQVLNLE